MGNEMCNKVQYGLENPAAHGTPVAATRVWPGQLPLIKSDTKPKFPKENVGVRVESFRSLVGQYLYQNTLSVEDASFQHLPLLFSCGVKGAITPAEQTTGEGDYLWDFTPTLTGANNPDSFTMQLGDDVQAWIAEYCMFDSIRISGTIGQTAEISPVKLEGSLFGRALAEGAFTAAVNPPAQEPLNAKLAQLYCDTAWASVGNTELANLLRAFDIQILTGVHPKFEGSTSKRFNQAGEGTFGVLATFTIEGGADAVAKLAAQQAGTFGVYRLKITGSQIGAGDNHLFTLDFGGALEDATPISGADRGDNLGTFVVHGLYDFVGTKLFVPQVTTDINAV